METSKPAPNREQAVRACLVQQSVTRVRAIDEAQRIRKPRTSQLDVGASRVGRSESSVQNLHTQIVNEILKPRWADKVAVAIKPKQIKDWLYTIVVEDTTRHKYKAVMGVVYKFAQSEGLLPLGEQFNPVSYVTAVSDYEAIALTPEQALKVLEQLQQPEYTMIVMVAATGTRASEMLGLCWSDILWERSEIKIKQTFVHGNIQRGAKTKLSKASVTMHPFLAQLL